MKITLKKVFIVLLVIVVILGGYSGFALSRPLPLVKGNVNSSILASHNTTSSAIAWPTGGESAIGILGTSIIDTTSTQVPLPTASTAKLITALMVLRAKPLTVGEQGPTITLTTQDMQIYNSYVAEQGSVVKVQTGEQISEYQMLEAMLLPSANNMADSLAIWAYGSLSAYSTAANSYVKSLGLSGTTIGSDASGFQPTTLSTASDLIKIGELALNNPVLAGIVSEPTATDIPVVGTITNVNTLLGQDNIIGIKTGNTDQAGGVFVGAAQVTVDGTTQVVLTAYMGAPSLKVALSSSLPFIKSAQSNIKSATVLHKGAAVGSYTLPWDHKVVNVVIDQTASANYWSGDSYGVSSVKLKALSYPAPAGDNVGSLSLSPSGSINPTSYSVTLANSFTKPSIIWRLLHP